MIIASLTLYIIITFVIQGLILRVLVSFIFPILLWHKRDTSMKIGASTFKITIVYYLVHKIW